MFGKLSRSLAIVAAAALASACAPTGDQSGNAARGKSDWYGTSLRNGVALGPAIGEANIRWDEEARCALISGGECRKVQIYHVKFNYLRGGSHARVVAPEVYTTDTSRYPQAFTGESIEDYFVPNDLIDENLSDADVRGWRKVLVYGRMRQSLDGGVRDISAPYHFYQIDTNAWIHVSNVYDYKPYPNSVVGNPYDPHPDKLIRLKTVKSYANGALDTIEQGYDEYPAGQRSCRLHQLELDPTSNQVSYVPVVKLTKPGICATTAAECCPVEPSDSRWAAKCTYALAGSCATWCAGGYPINKEAEAADLVQDQKLVDGKLVPQFITAGQSDKVRFDVISFNDAYNTVQVSNHGAAMYVNKDCIDGPWNNDRHVCELIVSDRADNSDAHGYRLATGAYVTTGSGAFFVTLQGVNRSGILHERAPSYDITTGEYPFEWRDLDVHCVLPGVTGERLTYRIAVDGDDAAVYAWLQARGLISQGLAALPLRKPDGQPDVLDSGSAYMTSSRVNTSDAIDPGAYASGAFAMVSYTRRRQQQYGKLLADNCDNICFTQCEMPGDDDDAQGCDDCLKQCDQDAHDQNSQRVRYLQADQARQLGSTAATLTLPSPGFALNENDRGAPVFYMRPEHGPVLAGFVTSYSPLQILPRQSVQQWLGTLSTAECSGAPCGTPSN